MRTRITLHPRSTRRRGSEPQGAEPVGTPGPAGAKLTAAREAVAAAERFLDRAGPDGEHGHVG
jgi:hypothetical protein